MISIQTFKLVNEISKFKLMITWLTRFKSLNNYIRSQNIIYIILEHNKPSLTCQFDDMSIRSLALKGFPFKPFLTLL
jgi:hypothetical protein